MKNINGAATWCTYLHSAALGDAEVRGDPIAALDFHQVAQHQLLRQNAVLLPVADHGGVRGDEVLEWVHDARGLGLLVIGEAAGDNHHHGQHDPEVQLQCKQDKKMIKSFPPNC